MKRILFLGTLSILIGFTTFLFPQNVIQKSLPSGVQAANPNIIYMAQGGCVFYDKSGNTLLTVDSIETGWSVTPALAAWVLVKPASGWYFEFPNYSASNVPTCNAVQYMRPFWNSDTIYNELIALSGVGKSANLMFVPKKILSVTNYDFSKNFVLGTDYSLNGRTITQVSSAPSLTYSTKSDTHLLFTNPQSWTCVTYIPDRKGWGGANIFTNKSAKLPGTYAKLLAKQPVVIEALGMSITAGLNVSGFIGDKNVTATKPYMHSYVDLMADELHRLYGGPVTMINSSCGGKTAAWVDQYCTAMINPNNPDLVLIDMGMNDIWGTTNPQFKASIQSAISKIKAGCPNAEFILIDNMLPDVTGMGAPSNGNTLMYGLSAQLQSLEAPGIVNLDMTQMSDTIYKRKSAKSCLTNSLHPNDYLARWYAQGLVGLFYTYYTSIPCCDVEVNSISEDGSEVANVYPNPVVDGHFIVKFNESNVMDGTVSIFDMNKQIITIKQTEAIKDYNISSFNLPSGIYMIKITNGDKSSTTKIIVK